MGRVIIKESKIIPSTFNKYLRGICPSNLTRKATKTEKIIKIASDNKKNNNLIKNLFSINIFANIFFIYQASVGSEVEEINLFSTQASVSEA